MNEDLDSGEDNNDTVAPVCEDLSEEQLRQMYDEDEVERFLVLFSAYVSEVRLPSTNRLDPGSSVDRSLCDDAATSCDSRPQVKSDPTDSPSSNPRKPPPLPPRPGDRSFSQRIARNYVLPMLPPPSLPPPAFTIGRLKLTTQRLYLAAFVPYRTFFVSMAQLSLWIDPSRSARYCLIFWILWYHNVLLPALLLRLIYDLLRRHYLPYPTSSELRQRRNDLAQAQEVGDEIQHNFLSNSPMNFTDIWRVVKIYGRKTKGNGKALSKGKGILKDQDAVHSDEVPPREGGHDESRLSQSDRDLAKIESSDAKQSALHALNEIADLHERIKNIFIWREPAVSLRYAFALLILFLITLFVPARYLAKLVYFLGGLLFWHIAPVIAALSPDDRRRFPSAFADAPTDAEYAMGLISQRVAKGLDVKPSRHSQRPWLGGSASDSKVSTTHQKSGESSSVDWKKWGGKVATGKAMLGEGKHIITGRKPLSSILTSPRSFFESQPSTSDVAPVETHTFPAQHSAGPGLITLTSTTFFFTPLASSNPKTTVALNQLRGVKKAGMMKGLGLTWAVAEEGGPEIEKTEKFFWVGERDELFARLVGLEGRRWKNI